MRSRARLGFSHVFVDAFLGVALATLTGSCTVVQPAPGYVSSGTATFEVNVDRPGSDYRSFDLGSGRPEECRDTCLVEPQCVAFTFVNPGVQAPVARCLLKSAAPAPSASACCISGVKHGPPSASGTADGRPPLAYPAPTPPSQGSLVGTPAGGHPGMEMGTDRHGGDYANFDLPQPHPHLCKEACLRDARCRAFTYVNPGVQGPSPRCWLKDTVPQALSNPCCVSGVKGPGHAAAPVAAPPFEMNVDRPGYDFQNFELPQPRPELCRDACLREGQCRAFTYVNPGVQGPNARCWLKKSAPPSTPNNCCISGVK